MHYYPNRRKGIPNREAHYDIPRVWDTLIGKTMAADGGMKRDSEVVPGIIGEHSPVKVDHSMRTTLEGLWAVGNTCYTPMVPATSPCATRCPG